jgi:hypothetical protein
MCTQIQVAELLLELDESNPKMYGQYECIKCHTKTQEVALERPAGYSKIEVQLKNK